MSTDDRENPDEVEARLVSNYNELAEMAGSLAHEIKNPLSVIRMNMDLLAEDFADPATQAQRRAVNKVDLVRRQCERLETLLNDFLRFVRLRNLDLRAGNLNEQVERVLELFGAQADESGIELVRYLDANLPSIMLEPQTLQAALVNLVKNALEAMPDGGRLEVRTRQTRFGVALDLIDIGCGMDQNTAIHMFDAFYSTKNGGSGLGLPTARKIVEAHGGRIDVASAVGHGTKFTIEFPTPKRIAQANDAMNLRDFQQIAWDEETVAACRQLVRLAVYEDLRRAYDVTTLALVDADAQGAALLRARRPGVVAGLPAATVLLEEMDIHADWQPHGKDGDRVAAADVLARIQGPTRDLLTAERILLNLIGRLCGIATLARAYVDAVAGTGTRVYDTRKTTPGWRLLEKYAVQKGGAHNHRSGLFDAVLIKDNHLAQSGESPRRAVERARQFLRDAGPAMGVEDQPLIEVEVDSLGQLHDVLSASPDIILLDNMSCEQLRQAVAARNASGAKTELEASGGITLATIRDVAETGVERISVGALTHSATSLDVGLDWEQ